MLIALLGLWPSLESEGGGSTASGQVTPPLKPTNGEAQLDDAFGIY